MKLAVHVWAVLIFGLPAASVRKPDNGVVSVRKSGTWNVPWMSRTPLVSVTERTANVGA